MSLSSSTAQSRELNELRNHLKWLDEERRKSARKMAELEQRIAQQGRELVERDQKLHELETQLAELAENQGRSPDEPSDIAAQEQRVQDLEWQLSNLAAQVSRLPKPEDERALWQSAVADVNSGVQRMNAQLEATKAEASAALVAVDLTKAEIAGATSGFDATRSDLEALRAELTTTQAALDNAQAEFGVARTALAEAVTQLQQTVDSEIASAAGRTASLPPEFVNYAVRLDELETAQAAIDERIAAIAAQAARDYEVRLGELEAAQAAIDERIAAVAAQAGSVYDVRLGELEAAQAAIDERIAAETTRLRDELLTRLGELEAAQVAFDERLIPLKETLSLQSNYAARLDEIETASKSLDERLAIELRDLHEERDSNRRDMDALAVRFQEQVRTLAEHNEGVSAELMAYAPRLDELQASVERMDETVARLGNVRELMSLMAQIDQEMELRQAEEVRLAGLIATQDSRFSPLVAQIEGLRDEIAGLTNRVMESEQTVSGVHGALQELEDNWKPLVTETNSRLSPISERQNALVNSMMKVEAGLQGMTAEQAEVRERLDDLAEDLRRMESDTTRQLTTWQMALDEQKETIERFTQQWITLSGQYKEARMAVQNFAHWQKQLEQQKREGAELVRIETGRMQARWDGFLSEIQERLRNFEVELGQKLQAYEIDNEQKWAAARRAEQIWREEIRSLDGLIQKLQQDNRNLIWRVQAAQADAIKKWPRMLMEEVEKAVEIQPERRLPSAAGPSAPSELSVVDAIEQGFITINYSDEPTEDQ